MDMKKLIEKMDQFAGQAVGQKPGDQVRGTEKATKKKSGKHPFAGRLVGSSESKNMLADLEKQLIEGKHERDLKEEFAEFSETIRKVGDKYRLYSHKGKNLGTFDSREAAEKHEREVQYFKHVHESTDMCQVCGQTPCNCTHLNESIGGVYEPPAGEASATDSHSPSPIGSIEEENQPDTVTMDIPFLIRVMEFSREDAKDDMILHSAVEKMMAAQANSEVLTMDNYEEIFGAEQPEQAPEQGVAEGSEDKIAKHNAAVAKMTKRSFAKLDYNHPDLLKTAPKGYMFSINHKLVPNTWVREGVAEGAPELLKAEIPLVREIERSMEEHGYVKGTEEYKKVFDHMLAFHRKFGNADRINQPHIDEAGYGRNRGYHQGFGSPTAPRLGGGRRDMDDEANVMYRYSEEDGRLKQRMVNNTDRDNAKYEGWKDSHEQALRAYSIIRSKFDPNKYVQKQGNAWVQVFPYGKPESTEESIEGHQGELEKNLRYERSRSSAADTIRGEGERWLVKVWDGHSNSEFERKGTYNQVANSLAGYPPGYITSIEPIGKPEVKEDEEFGYKKLHPEIFKARQKYPAAKSDMEALILAVRDEEEADVKRIDTVNDREDAEIDALDHEEDHLQSQIQQLQGQLSKLQAMASARTMKEEVPAPVATAGGPAGATQPQQNKPVDPAQQAAQKQQQSKMQQNLANLKTAGVDIDPAKAAQTLQKTDTGAPMNAMDKDTIAKMAPAIGNVMSNPSTATQLNTLIKKAGGGV